MRILRHGGLGACLLIAGAGLAVGSRAQLPPPSVQPPFAADVVQEPSLTTDARLQKSVTLDEVGTPIGELLQKLSGKGLILKCGDSCVNQKVHIRLNKRPLHVLMQSLAELLPAAWTPMTNSAGYRLEMTSKAVRYRENWWALYQGERDRALQAQRDFVLTRMRQQLPRELGPGPNVENVSPETVERAWQEHEFWRQLPSALQERVAGTMLATSFFAPGGVYGFPKEDNVVVPISDLGAESQQRLRAKIPALQAGQDANVEFCNLGYSVAAIVPLPDQPFRAAFSGLGVGIAPDAAILHPNTLAWEMKKRGKNAPDAWKKLAAYQQSCVWTTANVRLEEQSNVYPRRAETLDWLADRADLEFVADYYSRMATPLSLTQKQSKPTRPLKAELDLLATQQDMSWRKRDDGIYLARDNRWYTEDYYEVPAPLLRDWKAAPLPPLTRDAAHKPEPDTVAARTAAQLSLQSDIAARLTPWQIGNGLSCFVDDSGSRLFDPEHPNYIYQPFTFVATHILNEYSLLQFVNTLSPEQRAALLNGKLPVAALDAKQQERAFYLLPELPFRLARQPAGSVLLELNGSLPTLESASGTYGKGRIDLFNFSLTVAGSRPPSG